MKKEAKELLRSMQQGKLAAAQHQLASEWVAWAALHVMVSVLNAFHAIVVHSVLFVAIAWLLFRPEARKYFVTHSHTNAGEG